MAAVGDPIPRGDHPRLRSPARQRRARAAARQRADRRGDRRAGRADRPADLQLPRRRPARHPRPPGDRRDRDRHRHVGRRRRRRHHLPGRVAAVGAVPAPASRSRSRPTPTSTPPPAAACRRSRSPRSKRAKPATAASGRPSRSTSSTASSRSTSPSRASGGTEDETSDDYLARLAEALTILAPRPILPNDFAVLARQVPGVGRATAIDLYQPATADGGYGTPRGSERRRRTCRAASPSSITAADGAAPPTTLMQEVFNLLDGNREVNFLDLRGAARATPRSTCTATVTALPRLPARRRRGGRRGAARPRGSTRPRGAPRPGSITERVDVRQHGRLYEAVEHLNRAAGVHYVDSVQIRKAGGTFAAADVALDDPGRAAAARHASRSR